MTAIQRQQLKQVKIHINPQDKGGAMTAQHTPINAYDVYLNNKLIDTVFDQDPDPNEVRRALIDHDNYDPNITVKKAPSIRKARGE